MNSYFLFLMGIGIQGFFFFAAVLLAVRLLKKRGGAVCYALMKVAAVSELFLGIPLSLYMIANENRIIRQPTDVQIDFQEILIYDSDMEAFMEGGLRGLETLCVIWEMGFLVVCVGGWILARRNLKKLRKLAVRDEGEDAETAERIRREMGFRKSLTVYRSGLIDGPFVTGYRNPEIFLPMTLRGRKRISCVLRHEIFHCVRKDLWWKRAIYLLCGLMWYNPLVWIYARIFEQYGEIACDLCCSEGMTKEEKSYYSALLVDLAEVRNVSGRGLLFGSSSEKIMKRRIYYIMKGKRATKTALALVLAGVAGAVPVITYAGVQGNEIAKATVTERWRENLDETTEVCAFPVFYTQEEPIEKEVLEEVPFLPVYPRAVTGIDVSIQKYGTSDIRKASLTKGKQMELACTAEGNTSAMFTVKIINTSTGETKNTQSIAGTLGMSFTAPRTGTYLIRIVNHSSFSIHLTGTMTIKS